MAAFMWLVRLRIAANLVLAGYFMLWHPHRLASVLGLEAPSDPAWIRALGAAYVFVALAYVPSAIAPRRCMPSNLFVILGPILPIILLLVVAWSSSGVIWLVAYELLFAIVLSIAFQRGFVAEVMSKP